MACGLDVAVVSGGFPFYILACCGVLYFVQYNAQRRNGQLYPFRRFVQGEHLQ